MNYLLKSLLLSLLFLIPFFALGQNLDGFKYVYVPDLQYQNGGTDIWSISSKLRTMFAQKGFKVIKNGDGEIMEIKQNPCILLRCFVDHTNVTYGTNTVYLTLKDCNDRVVLSSSGSAAGWSVQDDFNKATKRAFSKIEKINYKYSFIYTPKRNLPSVEKTNETEESLKSYFDSNSIDQIEGIYKSYQDETLGHYKIGIKKYGEKYKAIIIESSLTHWNKGEVKAVFEVSSMAGLYSVKWFMGNKSPVETFAMMDNPVLLSVELFDSQGEKKPSKFIKMYPSTNASASASSELKATGSGFAISTDGIIATNAHVIEGSDSFELIINTVSGLVSYNATLLLKDIINDIALLKINDVKFKGFSTLPYSIITKTEIGEDVFTIGYPLNSIMGDNYKVTNGIISANSGFKDDIRYVQITTPIQPGNSGGPLFNKEGNIIGITTAKLNGEAVGTNIENVNYAIKADYLINVYNMLPSVEKLGLTNSLSNKELKEQVKILKDYVCLIKVY